MGPAAMRWRRERKVGEHSAGRSRAREPRSSRLRGGTQPPRGRSLGSAVAARAEPADTCGRRAGARRAGSLRTRGTANRSRLFTSARGCYFQMECCAGCTAEWLALGAAGAGWGTRRGPLHGFPWRCFQASEALPTAGFQCSRRLGTERLFAGFALCPSLNVDEVFPPRNTVFFEPGLGSFIHVPEIKPPASLPPGGSARPGCCGHQFRSRFQTLTYSLAHNILAARWTLTL